MIKSMYIHIPFCNRICSYCDFPKVYYNKKFINKYLNALEKEIEELYKGELLSTIYIGGGTPSALSFDETRRLFKILSKLKKEKNCEFTIEANFDSIDEEKLKLYKEYGINRISFGLETTNDKHLKFLNRDLDKNKVKDIINKTKSIGINNINIDLMYGLPNETIEDLNKDLDFILSLDITHISTYSLIIEEHTKIFLDKVSYIDEDLDYEMYEVIRKRLEENGFHQYEISNFAKVDYKSRHNLTYWNNEEYYGVGMGASFYIGNIRGSNTRSLNKYLEGKYLYKKEELTLDDKCTYEMILGLRKVEGVNKNKFYRTYYCVIPDKFDIMELEDKGLLEENDEFIYIPKDKLYIQNEILISFIGGK